MKKIILSALMLLSGFAFAEKIKMVKQITTTGEYGMASKVVDKEIQKYVNDGWDIQSITPIEKYFWESNQTTSLIVVFERDYLRGVVQLEKINIGTKLEKEIPVLNLHVLCYCNQGNVRLFLEGDDSENNKLKSYLGKEVEIEGYSKKNVFHITEIRKLEN